MGSARDLLFKCTICLTVVILLVTSSRNVIGKSVKVLDAYELYNHAHDQAGKGNYLVAIEDLKLAIAIKPQFVDAWILLSWYLYSNDRYGQAARALKQARQLKPKDAYILWLSGVIHYALWDDDPAKEFLQQSQDLQRGPNPDIRDDITHALLGSIFKRKKDLFRAKYHYSKAVDLAPDNWEYLFLLGVIQFHRERLTDSVESLRKALKLNPSNLAILNALVVSSGQLEVEIFRYNKRWEREQNPKRLRGAIHLTKRAIRRDPKNAVNHYDLGILYFLQGDYKKAVQAHRQAISHDPGLPGPYKEIARALLHIDTTESKAEAVDYLIKGISISPTYINEPSNRPSMIYMLFRHLVEEQRWHEAEAIRNWAKEHGYATE